MVIFAIYSKKWEWRAVLARTGKVAYGKFYKNKAGFVSKKCFPEFANYRRKGYNFDAAYEDGKGGEKNFEGTIAKLQMRRL